MNKGHFFFTFLIFSFITKVFANYFNVILIKDLMKRQSIKRSMA